MADEIKVIKLYESKNQLTTDAVDKIVVEIFNKRKEESLAQTIVLTGCSPLVGTTSTCIGLGIAIATTQRRTLLIDCDVRKSIKYKKLNDKTSVGIANYLVQDVDDENLQIDDIIYATNISNLSYIPCGNCNESSTRILCSTRMERLLEAVRDKFDCVIFDFPSLAVVPDAQILFNEVDGIVLLAALGETRKKQIKEAKMKVAPYLDKYYGMIINKVRLDVYKKNVRDYNYYFVDKEGEQKFKGNAAYKKYKKNVAQTGGVQEDE
ncbi:MAG: CpsD/CapB family tyrosine-protein kinase [Lachnospiraceae bacterium]|nr:CpsD/CapB family tyrosine-protein kinase [Lachnospiraceae bacterium]